MRKLKFMFYKILVRYYEKRWLEAIRYIDMYIDDSTSVEFRKAAYLNTKYGNKAVKYMNKIGDLLKES